ncbi:MAG: rod-binding protein [Helicobacteraceae bacterium]|jgi:Rod binding domain-containing protein|nr:rod-binding protein [Helicobacteraceae bacterium]
MQTVETLLPRNAILDNVMTRPAETSEKLKEQTDNFEALILKQMLDISMPNGNSLFGDSAGSEIYRSMYHEELANALSGGFGYSELLFNFLSDRLQKK